MSRPISKRLLNCSAVYYHVTGKNADRKPTYSEPVTLANIWFTATQQTVDGGTGTSTSDKMKIFFDCVNSAPLNFVPYMNDKVVFENYEYFVNSITPCYADNGLHHYEIGLR